MKIYTKVVIDIDTLETIEEESFEYEGPVALCGGGSGSTTTTVDKVYNAGMLALSQEQWATAEKFVNQYFHGVDYDPDEEVLFVTDEDGKKKEITAEEAETYGLVKNPDYVEGHYESTAGEERGETIQTWVEPQGSEYIQGDGSPVETMTRGELEGYYVRDDNGKLVKADGSPVSESDYYSSLIESNMKLIDEQTMAELDKLGLDREQIRTAMEMLPLLTENQKNQLGLSNAEIDAAMQILPNATELKLASIGKDQAEIDAIMKVLPYKTDAEMEGYGLSAEQSAAARSLLPGETALSAETTQSQRDILPSQTASTIAANEASTEESRQNMRTYESGADATISGNELTTEQNRANLGLVKPKTDLELQKIQDEAKAITERAPVRSEFYDQSLQGVDINRRMDQAQAGVQQASDQQLDIERQRLADAGVNMDPSSGAYRSMLNRHSLNTATNVSAARTLARENAEGENYNRLRNAMTI